MIEIDEKIAVNSTINKRLPGKKYSRKLGPTAAAESVPSRKLRDRPAPNSSQNTSGVPIEPTIRFRWRKNRTISRQASAVTARQAELAETGVDDSLSLWERVGVRVWALLHDSVVPELRGTFRASPIPGGFMIAPPVPRAKSDAPYAR
jgi:hypothetical protein